MSMQVGLVRQEFIGSTLESFEDTNNYNGVVMLAQKLLEPILYCFTIAKHHHLNNLYIITDRLFSQIWFQIYKELATDKGWRKMLQEDLCKLCNVLWFPSDFGCCRNILDLQPPGSELNKRRPSSSPGFCEYPRRSNLDSHKSFCYDDESNCNSLFQFTSFVGNNVQLT
ncbi:hypothetical protein LIER_30317 [Lithospermum erythrorhizon]|uniref:Uncharacterized protein n=1 Tax=Lithospermum erythrorhizon TaxID=34254 RepID=A0AAV3RQH9_LITER